MGMKAALPVQTFVGGDQLTTDASAKETRYTFLL